MTRRRTNRIGTGWAVLSHGVTLKEIIIVINRNRAICSHRGKTDILNISCNPQPDRNAIIKNRKVSIYITPFKTINNKVSNRKKNTV